MEEEEGLYPSAADFEYFVSAFFSDPLKNSLNDYLNKYDEKFRKQFADLRNNQMMVGEDVLVFLLSVFARPRGVTLQNIKWLIIKKPSNHQQADIIVGFLAFFLQISKEDKNEIYELGLLVRRGIKESEKLIAFVERILRSRNIRSARSENQENVVEFLEKPYISRFGVEKSFGRRLIDCFLSKNGKIYAPYFSVCQRSGSGKTKLLLYSGSTFSFMVYILLEERKYGTPKHIIDLLKSFSHPDFSDNELLDSISNGIYVKELDKATRFLYALAQYLVEFVEGGCGQNKGVHKEHDCNCFSRFLENFKPNKNVQITADSWNRIIEIMGKNDLIDLQPFFRLENLNARFVIALDEARNLIDNYDDKVNPFQIIRHALAVTFEISKTMLCMIVTDTNSNITNFAPSATGGSHYSRRNIPPGRKLHDPFYILSGHDIKASEYLEKAMDSLDNMHDFTIWRDQNTRKFITLGSPLWSLHLSSPNSVIGTIEEIITYAGYKLNEGTSFSPKEQNKIAFLAAKCNIDIVPHFELAKNLVAGNMALLHYLTVDRHLAFVGYPSDPVLAAGATAMILESCHSSESHPIEVLQNHVSRSIIDAGQGGELVAQIYLLAAFEAVAKDPFKSISVSQFLCALLGQVNFESLQAEFADDASGILDGRVYFNHTIKLQKDATFENLQHAFIRGAMISGRHVQPGWDHCIPVALPNGLITAMYFQEKNYGKELTNSLIKGFCLSSRLVAMAIHEPESAEIYNSALKQMKGTKRRKLNEIEEMEDHSLIVNNDEIRDRLRNFFINDNEAKNWNISINDQENDKKLSSIIENPGFDSQSLHFLINFKQGKSSSPPNFHVSQQDRFVFIEGSASQIVHHAWCSEGQKTKVYESLENLLLGQIKYRALLESDPVRSDFYQSDHGFWNHDLDILRNPT